MPHSKMDEMPGYETAEWRDYAWIARVFSAKISGRGIMDKTLAVINKITRLGIIKAYAVAGGVAATYYIEPVLTYDLDIFFIPADEGLDILTPIYAYAEKAGYKAERETIIIEGIPVQFIPVYNDLIREAVENAAAMKYRDVEAKVVAAEYLIAIALQTGRAKDKARTAKLVEEADIDRDVLMRILNAHGLAGKFKPYDKR